MENKKVEGRVCNCNIGEDQELKQDEEEEKMEKFFALIKSFHEARKRRKQELDELLEEEKNKKNKSLRSSLHEKTSWVPAFEWQDFTGDIEFRKPPLKSPGPCNRKKVEEKKEQEDDRPNLDLNLAL